MKLLGLSVNAAQSSAALLLNGAIQAAAAEERFNRIKHSRAFPRQAISYCLKQAGIKSINELDGIAISWNPAENMRSINLSGFTEWRRYDPEWLYIVPNHLLSMSGHNTFRGDVLKMEISHGTRCPLYYVKHHYAHLAQAISQSPFTQGLAVISDEYGEINSFTIAQFNGTRFKIIKEIPYPHSLGAFYAAFTEYLGFVPNMDEWKVMGAAAYGKSSRFNSKLQALVGWDDREGQIILDTRYIEHSNMKRAGYLSELLVRHIGVAPRNPAHVITQQYFDLAAAVQAIFEKMLFKLLSYYAQQTNQKNLAASGGCFMNSLANGKIISNTPFRKIFIPYAAADNGGAMGAALYVHHYVHKNKRAIERTPPSPFLGPGFSDFDIETVLRKCNLPYRRLHSPVAAVAEMIANGKLVGWFQGRMEFGERALGNRSILTDPRDPGMKDKINLAVKYREPFRPFAPSILAEKANDYFIIPPHVTVPYMEQVYAIRPHQQRKIPAVSHNDGTGRLQMVSKQEQPLFYNLIEQFNDLTGIPLLLNTSFNVQGEPIVCTPQDAIRTFYSCGLNVLCLGNYILQK